MAYFCERHQLFAKKYCPECVSEIGGYPRDLNIIIEWGKVKDEAIAFRDTI